MFTKNKKPAQAKPQINPSTRIMVRVLVSVYILYIAYELIRDFGSIPSGQRIWIGLSIALFIIAPALILIDSYKDWKRLQAKQAAEAAAEAAEAAAQEPMQALAEDEDDLEAEDTTQPDEDVDDEA